jgi:AraC family transcriptional regulator of adaptative response/methylated-DNA-[protein]-cysteine methyltransferase
MKSPPPKAISDRFDSSPLRSRDPSLVGRFVYGVTSTGIYCSPACPSRPAKPEHVRYFDHPAEARAAGFRACLRCHPDSGFPAFLPDFVI